MEKDSARLGRAHFADFEAFSLEQIKAARCEGTIPQDSDNFSWLALLQHHGCKTRLVDFTESIYVALYFAYREAPTADDLNADSAGAIWAINKPALEARVAEIVKWTDGKLEFDAESRSLLNLSIQKSLLRQHDKSDELGIVFGEPGTPNNRMMVQRGLFLAPLNLEYDFKQNLTAGLNLTGTYEPVRRLNSLDDLRAALLEELVVKIRLAKTMRTELLSFLANRGITEASLFPGLDGYARSLNYRSLEKEGES